MSPLLFAHLLTLSLFLGLLVAAALGDIKSYRIPNAFSLALLALYPLFALTAPHPVAPLLSLGVASIVLAAGFALFSMRMMGGGDVKLIAAASLFAGPDLALEFVLMTTLFGGFVAVLMLNRPMRVGLAFALDHVGSRRLRDALLTETIPYGVAIAAGGMYLTLRLVGLAADAV